MFAPPDGPVRTLTDALSVAPVTLAMMTWGTLALEAVLAIAIVLPKHAKLILLPAGIAFHLVIAVLMGLWSFAFATWAGLVIAWPGTRDLSRKARAIAVEAG